MDSISDFFTEMEKYHVGSKEHQKILDELSLNPNLERHHLQSNSFLPWKLKLLSQNTNIAPDWVNILPNPKPEYELMDWMGIYHYQSWDFQEITNSVFEKGHQNNSLFGRTENYLKLKQDIKALWLQLYPDENWNYEIIYKYHSLNLKMLRSIPVEKHNYPLISCSPNLDITWVQAFPNGNWDFRAISINPNLTLEWIDLFPEKDWCFNKDKFSDMNHHRRIRCCDKLTYFYLYKFVFEWYEKYPGIEWDFGIISFLRWLKLQTVLDHPRKKWDFKVLSSHRDINLEFMKSFPEADWDFSILSGNENLNLKWLQEFPNCEWDFSILSENHNLKLKWIKEFPNGEWDFSKLSGNINLNLEILKEYPNGNWDFSILSGNKNLKLEWLQEFPNREWDFEMLHNSYNFKGNWVLKFPDKNWNFSDFPIYFFLNRKAIINFPNKNWIIENFSSEDPEYFKLVATHYQYYHPDINILDFFDILFKKPPEIEISIMYYKAPKKLSIWKFMKKPEVNTPIYLIKPELAENERFHKLLSPEILAYPKLNQAEKLNLLEFIEIGLKFNYSNPEIFSYPDCDLELVDLSGNVFYLSNWFRCDSIMDEIHNTFPELADIDVMVDDDIYDVCIMGSKSANKQLIEKICQNRGGPSVMIVYPEIKEHEDNNYELSDSDSFEINLFGN